jgi:hypothetical protein
MSYYLSLVDAAILVSGLPIDHFATRIVRVPERTLRRWQTGQEAVPPETRAQLEWFLSLTHWEREVYIRSATHES